MCGSPPVPYLSHAPRWLPSCGPVASGFPGVPTDPDSVVAETEWPRISGSLLGDACFGRAHVAGSPSHSSRSPYAEPRHPSPYSALWRFGARLLILTLNLSQRPKSVVVAGTGSLDVGALTSDVARGLAQEDDPVHARAPVFMRCALGSKGVDCEAACGASRCRWPLLRRSARQPCPPVLRGLPP